VGDAVGEAVVAAVRVAGLLSEDVECRSSCERVNVLVLAGRGGATAVVLLPSSLRLILAHEDRGAELDEDDLAAVVVSTCGFAEGRD